MQLIFERSHPGRGTVIFPKNELPEVDFGQFTREELAHLPEVSENEIDRHYTELSGQVHGVNHGFYPLGSCTMKYNPKVNDWATTLPGFAKIHPLQPESTVQGALEMTYLAEKYYCEVTGMDAMTFQPAGGSQGEFTGLLLFRAYHDSRGDSKRTKIIVPDSAHGTNPASAAVAGYEVVSIDSTEEGLVDLDALRAVVGEDTAGLMLTNPNTVGLFDKHITEITNIVHEAGGLCYYDGANFNAVMGVVRPGDMGFDVIHLNLHKSFSTPHGGGGPGSGPCGCKAFLAEFLPGKQVKQVAEDKFEYFKPAHTIGDVTGFYGNYLTYLRALTYLLTIGSDGVPQVAHNAVLNANYMMNKLKDIYPMAYDAVCMHEFVMSLSGLKHDLNVSAMDVAKALLDYGIHPPTMYFPLIVEEALMVEPTETETRETLDYAISVFRRIYDEAHNNPENMHHYPANTPIKRLDEVGAARNPKVRYNFDAK